MKLFTITMALALLAIGASKATTINVPADQPTIQAGIDAAVDGDTVLVASGTYVENIDFAGKNLVLQSTAGAGTTTIVPNDSLLPVVRFTSLETRNAKLSGFTIDGASSSTGIQCTRSSPTLESSLVTNCATIGGIVCDSSSNALLVGMNVSNNQANGITLPPVNDNESSRITIRNSLINDNMGDGLWAFTGDTITVQNSTFDSNGKSGLTANNGSFATTSYLHIDSSSFLRNEIGCFLDGGVSGTISNSSFDLNVNGSGYGVMVQVGNSLSSLLFVNCTMAQNSYGVFLQGADTVTLRNCLVEDNPTGVFSDFTSLHIEGGILRNCSEFGISTMSGSRPISIQDALIYNNGIGIDACCADSVVVTNCTIVNNTASLGSAIRTQFGVSVKVRNSIFAYNNGDDWVYLVPGGPTVDTSVAVSCSNIFSNGTGGVPPIIIGQLFSNENFISAPQFCDTASGDYQLLSTSPNLPTGNTCNQLVGAFSLGCEPSCCTTPGDFTGDGQFNISDVTFGIARIFTGGPPAPCQDEGDANGDNQFNITDVTYGIARIFSGGPAPVCGTTGT
jgi:Right handed beta helix region